MRAALYLTLVLVILNSIIFLLRHKGFDFERYSSIEKLCSPVEDSSDIHKWIEPNKAFLPDELEKARELLETELLISRYQRTDSMGIAIAAWLYQQFSPYSSQQPEPSIHLLTPLKQFYKVKAGQSYVWCGNYQYVYGFFCTAMGIHTRYIELSPNKKGLSSHVINEIYLEEHKQWAMVDVYKNKLLTLNALQQPLCAAEYYNILNSALPQPLITIHSNGSDTTQSSDMNDPNITEDYSLLYFYQTNVEKVYSTGNKIKRYLLVSPWYEKYPQREQFSNWKF